MKKCLSPYESLVAGIIAGTSSVSIQMPLLTYQFCRQSNLPLPKKLLGWYHGLPVQMVNITSVTAFQVVMNNIMIKEIFKEDVKDKHKIIIASLSGGVSALLYTPADFITICKQNNKCINNIYKNNGLKPFFKGIFPCILRESIYTSSYLGTVPIFSNYVKNKTNLNYYTSLIGSSIFIGALSSLITHPFDTAKTIMQTNYKEKNSTYYNIKEIAKNDGIKNLYKGFIPRTIRICGNIIICTHIMFFFENEI